MRVMPLFLVVCCIVMGAAAMAAFLDRGILAVWLFGGAVVAGSGWLIWNDR